MASVAQLPRMRAQSMTVEALTDRLAAVRKVLLSSSSFSAAAIESTLEWYFEKLGLPRTYFDTNDDETIAHHITSIQASGELAKASGRRFFDVHLTAEGGSTAFFAARSQIVSDASAAAAGAKGGANVRLGDLSQSPAIQLEKYIESAYLAQGESTALATGAADFRDFEQRSKEGVFSLSAKPSGALGPGLHGVDTPVAVGMFGQPSQPAASGSSGAGAVPASAATRAPRPWRLQCYRSKGVLEDGAHLRLYFLQAPRFGAAAGTAAAAAAPSAFGTAGGPALTGAAAEFGDLQGILDPSAIAATDPAVLEAYRAVLGEQASPSRLAPSIHIIRVRDVAGGEGADVAEPAEGAEVDAAHLVVAFKTGSAHSLFSGLSAVYRWYGFFAVVKQVEVTSTGITIFNFKLRPLDLSRATSHLAAAAAGSDASASASDAALRSDSGRSAPGGAPTLPPGHSHLASSMPPAALAGGQSTTAELQALARRTERYTRGDAASPPLEARLADLKRAVALHFVLPRTSTTPLLNAGLLSSQEVVYAYAAWKFAYHFLPRMSSELKTLNGLLKQDAVKGALGPRMSEALGILSRLRKAVQAYSFTEAQILDAIFRHPDVVAWCYANFAARLRPASAAPACSSFGAGRRHSRRNSPLNPQGGAGHVQSASCDAPASHGSPATAGAASTTAGVVAGAVADAAGKAAAAAGSIARLISTAVGMDGAASPGGSMLGGAIGGAAGPASPMPGSPAATMPAMSYEEGVAHLRKVLKNDDDIAIFSAFLAFNRSILKTNFYRSEIVSLAFRLDPAGFLSGDYADNLPHGIFMMVSAEARGFHCRFADIARGGIRLIKSASPQAYSANVGGLFDECYSLAATQHLKNKDIVESGSKGVILLNLAHQDKATTAFHKYMHGLLDLLLVPSPEVVDYLGKQEIIFCGPDENTAELMDWACLHGRARGYPFWKAFTTGKGFHLGGVPHDKYAMTTRGVRAYVTGIQRKFGLLADSTSDAVVPAAKGKMTKAMTGGPDGDLGSNEILLANEAIVAVVDGSGVLHDPAGLDKAELQRLAGGRLAVAGFDRSKLGPQGYLVLVGDTDVRLPNGTLVASGLSFRNNYHLYADVTADFFVPCGGRPAAVNADNVDVFLYGTTATDGSVAAAATGSGAASGGAGALPTDAGAGAGGVRRPRFKWIVEGANLFFTNDARLKIEAAGVVLVKDSSANKGGVTSSSLEVLAALALTDAEFSAHMCIPAATRSPVTGGSSTPAPVVEAHGGHGLPDNLPAFYRRYVAEVQRIIEANAALEFECLWREHDRTGTPYTLLSDQLSSKITALSTKIEASDSLWGNTALRGLVLRDALPKTLTELVGGYDVVLGRLPENYLRALFGSRLASRFIYESGLATDEFSFYSYLDSLLKHGGAGAAVAGGSVAAAAGVGAKGGAGAALVAM